VTPPVIASGNPSSSRAAPDRVQLAPPCSTGDLAVKTTPAHAAWWCRPDSVGAGGPCVHCVHFDWPRSPAHRACHAQRECRASESRRQSAHTRNTWWFRFEKSSPCTSPKQQTSPYLSFASVLHPPQQHHHMYCVSLPGRGRAV